MAKRKAVIRTAGVTDNPIMVKDELVGKLLLNSGSTKPRNTISSSRG